MMKCLLGCGQVVHDVDQHLAFSHPNESLPPEADVAEHGYDTYFTIKDIRNRYILENFARVTL